MIENKSSRPEPEYLKEQWQKKFPGKDLTILKKDVGGFEVRLNPLRAKYMTTTQHAVIDTDVFCHKWDSIVENEQIGEITLPHFSWIMAINTSPIEQYHSLLICAQHQEQTMTLECLEDLYAFSLVYPEISAGFNGWNAGASQKHLHGQLFFSKLPVEDWKRDEASNQLENYPGICLVFTSPQVIFAMIEQLNTDNIPFNVLFTNGTMYLIPRKNGNDYQNTKRGFDSVFGKVPMLTQEQYDQATLVEVRYILTSLMYQSLEIGNLSLSI